MSDTNDGLGVYNFPIDKNGVSSPSIIKVIGVGGGGSNAVNHMYREGIHDVTFAVCNTDNKALQDSPVPHKIQLGREGLGAGNKPEKAKQATEESLQAIKEMLNDGTKMVFITAGMDGGTGTGAAPIIAKTAKDMDILTVGIVTIPFKWEGKKKINQALDGVEEISRNVDALLVINNERLREIYQDFTVVEAFAKADDTLCNAARSIAEIITMHGIINLDFNDVKTVLKDGGVAIMSSGYGEGESRVTKAINDALHSPLLNNNDIYRSKKVLLRISFPDDKRDADDQKPKSLGMDEIDEVNEFMTKIQNVDVEVKWGMSIEPDLGNKVKITILATGFGVEDIDSDEMDERVKDRENDRSLMTAEQAELAARNAKRMSRYYGDEKDGASVRRPVYYYIFRDEELDDEDTISMVEASPTYKRTRETLKQLSERNVAVPSPEENKQTTIDFSINS